MKVLENKIQDILDERGLSIRQLSKDLNFSYNAAHRVVTSKYLDTRQLMTIEKVARYLNVSIEDLYENKEEEKEMLKELAKELLNKVEEEIKIVGFVDDSDMAERFIDSEAYKLLSNKLEDEDEAYDLTSKLVEMTKELFTEDIKQAVYEDNYCYYKTEEGLRKWVDLVLANETDDTHTEEDTDKLVNELM